MGKVDVTGWTMSSEDCLKRKAGRRRRISLLAEYLIIFCLAGVIMAMACCGHAIADANPIDTIVYTTNPGQNTLGVSYMGTGTLIGQIAGFNDPSRLAVSLDSSRVYVADAGDDSIVVLDTATNTPVARINLTESPLCIAMSRDDRKAYVTAGSNDIAIIDTATCSQTGTIRVGNSPGGICVNPRTGDVYVLNTGDKSVSVIRGSSVVATVQLDGYLDNGLAASPDGSRLLVADDYSTVYVIDTASDTVMMNFSTGQWSAPYGVTFSADGAYAYVACANSNSIEVYSTDNYTQVKAYSISMPDKVVMGPGGVLYVRSVTGRLTAMDAASGSVISAIDTGANDFDLVWIMGQVTIPDSTPPTATLSLAGPVDSKGAYIEAVTCTLTAEDNAGGSGVKSIEYCLSGQTWQPYAGPFNLSTPGQVSLMYRATDNAGNVESTQSKVFAIVTRQDAATPTPTPKPCPIPAPAPTAGANSTATPVTTASTTQAATARNPTSMPASTATPTPTGFPVPGLEAATAAAGITVAMFLLAARKR